MCIIAIKPAGVKLPASETIKNMWYNNNDGAGFMYTKGGNVHIRKGFMTLEDFNKALDKLKKEVNVFNTPVIMHFRITTHGGTAPGNTHPFPVTEKLPLLQMVKSKAPLAVAHNGMIDIKPSQKDISDTMEYILTQLAPLYQLKKDFYLRPEGKKLIYNAIRSKMAFLDGSGRIETIGDFTLDNGLLYSNTSYKARTIYYNWDMWDNYALEWYDTEYGKHLSWLFDDDGYIIINGDIVSAEWFLTDEKGDLYQYDIETDTAIPAEGTLYNHEGKPINGYKEESAVYMEIQV